MEFEFPEELTIEVKQEHIDEALGTPRPRQRCRSCPVALAALSSAPWMEESWVGPTRLLATVGRVEADYVLPIEARSFIDRFDIHLPVEPFTFTAKRIDV